MSGYTAGLQQAIWNADRALSVLDRYNPSLPKEDPGNREAAATARHYVSPGATSGLQDAFDAAQWDRWANARSLRSAGYGGETLHEAWYSLSPRSLDIDAARSQIRDGIAWLDRAQREYGRNGGWGNPWDNDWNASQPRYAA
jgi:hypothetical protein